MQRIGKILSRVLADLEAQFPQGDKGGIRAAVIAPCVEGTVGAEKGAGDETTARFNPCRLVSVASVPAPAGRMNHPKVAEGDK